MPETKILIIEDDDDVRELIKYNLARENYRVYDAADGEIGLDTANSLIPDLIILDLMLPGMNGLEICKELKSDKSTKNISVIILSAKGEETDIVIGLELGADDYITKPFSPRVLLARIKSVLRRKSRVTPSDDDIISVHNIRIDPGRYKVSVDRKQVDLTTTEFRLLQFLARHPGWVFSRYQIVDGIKGDDYPVTERSVDVHIVGLRKKLGATGALIETVRGVGYRLKDTYEKT